MPGLRIGIGLAIWIAAVSFVAYWVAAESRWTQLATTSQTLAKFAVVPRQNLSVRAISGTVPSVGDPVFFKDPSGQLQQVGEIRPDGRVEFYPSSPSVSSEQYELVFHHAEPSLSWLLQTVLPPQKQQAVLAEIRKLLDTRGQALLQTLRPVLAEWSETLLPELERDLGLAIGDHWPAIDQLARRWAGEIPRRDLDRLMREVCWPIVQKNVVPLADEVGAELWARVSFWRFGWRYLYDQSGLGDQAVRKEWDRFVQEEVMPILESRSDDFLEVMGTTIREIAANERIQQSVGLELKRMLHDPEFQRILGAVVKETLLDNPRLRDAVVEAFRAPEMQQAIQSLSIELEPTVDRIGVMIFGSAESGIDPDFARAIRRYVLGKDRRWLQLVQRESPTALAGGDTAGLLVVPARVAAPYPLRFFVGANP